MKELTAEEKTIFVTSLLYIMDLSKNQRMEYLNSRLKELGFDTDVLKKIKHVKKDIVVYVTKSLVLLSAHA